MVRPDRDNAAYRGGGRAGCSEGYKRKNRGGELPSIKA